MEFYAKERLLYVIFCLFCIQLNAQTLNLEVEIEDEFLKTPLNGVVVSVLTPDSATVVADSASCVLITDRNGKLQKAVYVAPVKAEKRDYLVRATLKGYGDVWQPVSVLFPEKVSAVKVPAIKMRKERSIALNEVVVKATKVKMYYKGDTLVYDADAFKLPDGSMLDALIRQLPGVRLNESGEIFVNGRKVDELLLGSRSFMRGNKKVLMENLPYYTVKDIKVYDKQSDMSEALGYDVGPRKYVMDVNLREEYKRGYIANVEAAGGTEDRWLGRGFLLGFTDRWRYSLMGNVNNVNESRHIGERGHWSPATMPQSLVTTRSLATDLDYESKDKKVKDNFNADFTSTSDDMKMRQRREQFLEGSKPTSLTESYNKSDKWHLKLSNRFTLKKPSFFYSDSHFDYEKRDALGSSWFDQWDDSLTASMRNDAMSEGRTWSVSQQLDGAFNTKSGKGQTLIYNFFFRHSDDQSWLSNRYDTWHATTQGNDVRHNANDVANRSTAMLFSVRHVWANLFKNVNLSVGEEFQSVNTKTHDYLYHPDTLLLASQLDMLTAITDPSNSYDSDSRNWRNTVSFVLYRMGNYKIAPVYNISYERWRVGVNVPVIHKSLDYSRGVIDTLTHGTWVYVSPYASFRYMSPDGRRDLRVNVRHDREPVELLDRIGYRDDSQPLVVKLGNPELKGKATTNASVIYADRSGSRQQQWHVGSTFIYRHRDVAQSVSYNTGSGVYTYKPMNVSGAYSVTGNFDFSRGIDKKCHWTWQMNADVSYIHSVDHSMLDGETVSHENAVNTTNLHDGAYIQYNKDALNIRVSGDIRWRHSEGGMRDFETLDALDFNYGLSARYTIPVLKTTVSADAMMYSRRGYGSTDLNTDDFVLNASLSQSLWKGKLIARVEAFDLLHQVSSVQYEVNAQGRTETWYRSLPRYVMLHLVYHWNKNPKKR